MFCPGYRENNGMCYGRGTCLQNLDQIMYDNGGSSLHTLNSWPNIQRFPLTLGSCVCYSGYRGTDCGLECPANLAPNNTRPCSAHGQCLADATCDCNSTQEINSTGISPYGSPTAAPVDAGWRGASCSFACLRGPPTDGPNGTKIMTNGSICSGHGRCLLNAECMCFDGWRRPDLACSRECLGGASLPCLGHGVCDANGSCICDYAFRLANCSLMCPGGPVPDQVCSGHGRCDEFAVCWCDRGWEGVNCERLAAWVIALITVLLFLLCCISAIAARLYYVYRMRLRRRARREARVARKGRTRIIEGRRAQGYTVLAPTDPDDGP